MAINKIQCLLSFVRFLVRVMYVYWEVGLVGIGYEVNMAVGCVRWCCLSIPLFLCCSLLALGGVLDVTRSRFCSHHFALMGLFWFLCFERMMCAFVASVLRGY